MSIVAQVKANDRVYVNAPASVYQGVLADVVDEGIVTPKDPNHKPAHKVTFVYQIDLKITKADVDAAYAAAGKTPDQEKAYKQVGRPFTVRRMLTLSLHEKAELRKFLKNWRGRDLTEAEVRDGLDLESLIGVNAQLNVVHEASKKDPSKVFANIAGITPWNAKFGPVIEVSADYVRVKDRPKDGQEAG